MRPARPTASWAGVAWVSLIAETGGARRSGALADRKILAAVSARSGQASSAICARIAQQRHKLPEVKRTDR
jgi:hypothetical protein